MSFRVFPSSNLDDIVIPRKSSMFLFQEEFAQNLALWGTTVTVTGVIGIQAVSGYSSVVGLRTGAGLGTVRFYTPINLAYSTAGFSSLEYVVLLQLPALATVAEDYTLHACYNGDAGGTGYSISYNRATGPNWMLTTWAAGVPTYAVDSGVAVGTTFVRLKTIWNTSTNNVVCFINDVSVGNVTMGGPAAANFYVPAYLIKLATAGVNTVLYVDYTYALATFNTPRA